MVKHTPVSGMISIIADFTATAQVILLAQRKKSRKAPPFDTNLTLSKSD
jgi:hypothetical protein